MDNLASKVIGVIDAFDRINRLTVVLEMAALIDEHYEPYEAWRFGLKDDRARLVYLHTLVELFRGGLSDALEDLMPLLDDLRDFSRACSGENPSSASPDVSITSMTTSMSASVEYISGVSITSVDIFGVESEWDPL